MWCACVLYLMILYLWHTFNNYICGDPKNIIYLATRISWWVSMALLQSFWDCRRLGSLYGATWELLRGKYHNDGCWEMCSIAVFIWNFNIQSVLAPERPTKFLYADLTKKLREHFSSKPYLAIMQCFKFNTCVRHPGEKIVNYIARLWELTQFCDFE